MQKFLVSLALFACAVRGRRLQLQQDEALQVHERQNSVQEQASGRASHSEIKANRLSREVSTASTKDASLAMSLLATNLPHFAVPTAASLSHQDLHRRHRLGHRDLAMNMNGPPEKVASDSSSKSATQIVSEGLGKLIKEDRTGWFFGKPSDLYSNLPSTQESARQELIRVVETLEVEMPQILSKDPSWDIFTEDLSIRIDSSSRVQGIGSCIILLAKMRKLCAEFGQTSSFQSSFLIERPQLQNAAMPEFLTGELKVDFGRVKLPHWDNEISLAVEVDISFHVNDRQLIDYAQIDKLLFNGRPFQMWPEAAVAALEEDIPNVLVREPTLEYFDDDFTAYDQTGITGNWYIPTLDTNKALLALVRQSRSAFSVIMKDDLQVGFRRSFVATPDGVVEPALIAQWRFAVRGEVEVPILGKSSLGNSPHLEGTSIFQFNPQGRISSMKITPLSIDGSELRLLDLPSV
jgi:hypothetical protein